ncbi:hypothetical protein NKH69_20995, partial [Mesorhizobium sp. M0976]|uniref:hypothetical protein n=1 Tax=Mesorhizobium sp. M0976 TaxID=2957038 RepID=UPI00333C7863
MLALRRHSDFRKRVLSQNLALNRNIRERLATAYAASRSSYDGFWVTGVDQAALCGFVSMTSIPSWNLAPASS